MRSWRPLALLLAALTLAACGTTAPATDSSPTASPASSAAGVSITDSRGKQISLPGPASKVVTLEWQVTEMVASLGVQPVGVADPKGFATWDTAVSLAGDPVDVGLRSEPSVESVAKVEPDLIIGVVGSIPESAMAQMEKIAPVAILTAADAKDQIGNMRTQFTNIATLLGKDAEARTVLEQFDAKIADARTRLDPAKAAHPIAFAYIFVEGNQVSLRTHTEASLPGAIGKAIGLKNAWTTGGDDAWGLGSGDIESLTKLPDDTYFLYWQQADETDPVKTTLAKNKVWTSLKLQEDGKVAPVANGIWLYGGPASMSQLIDNLVETVNS